MSKATRLIGLDPGFGGVKLAEVQDHDIVTSVLPSVVGVGTLDSGALSLGGVVRGRREAQPYRVGFEGVEYLVGQNVAQYARPIERMDFDRFTDGPELRALFYAALYQLLDGGGHKVALAVGLPVEILQDKARAQRVERNMSAWLVGRHQFTLDDTPAEFEIVKVRAKIAQPVATWFAWGLDLDGQWCRGAKAAKAPALVIDQGFNTLDLLVVEGGRISTRYTGGDALGMRRAAEMAAGKVLQRYGVELSLHEADDLVRRVVSGKRAEVYVEGEPVEVTPQVRQAINAAGADVVRFVERNVGKGRKFKVLLTGGGALALADRLLRQYPHAEVVEDPVLSNARGLAKLAARARFYV